MKTRRSYQAMLLVLLMSAFVAGPMAQNASEEASWGQVKSLFETQPAGPTGLAQEASISTPGEDDLSPMEAEILALDEITGSYDSVVATIADRGLRIESFTTAAEAEGVLCGARECFAVRLVTENEATPAVYRYRVIDSDGATVHFGFYTLPTLSPRSEPDGCCSWLVCWEDVDACGDCWSYAGDCDYVGYWANDEFSSAELDCCSPYPYFKLWEHSRYRGKSMKVLRGEYIRSLCPYSMNDKVSCVEAI